MRDAHRMKEKLDLSLDNRQIVSAIVAGLVVLGAVFVLGVVVGKKLATSAQAQNAPDLLSALDAKAAAMEEARAATPLTFQDELTRKTTDTPPRTEPAKVAVAVTPPAPAPVAEESVAELPSAVTAAAEQPETTAAATDVVVAKAEVPDAPDESVATRVAEKVAPAPKRAAAAVASGNFTLQLSATQTRAEADRFVSKLQSQGYSPYIIEAEVPGKGTWYRIRMGRFPTKDAAGRYLADFRRETRMEAFVASAQ